MAVHETLPRGWQFAGLKTFQGVREHTGPASGLWVPHVLLSSGVTVGPGIAPVCDPRPKEEALRLAGPRNRRGDFHPALIRCGLISQRLDLSRREPCAVSFMHATLTLPGGPCTPPKLNVSRRPVGASIGRDRSPAQHQCHEVIFIS